MKNPGFWKALDKLVAESKLVIDRPKGSAHPCRPDVVYQMDYGYLSDTRAPDGEGIDVWRGSREDNSIAGIFATADLFKRDGEIKFTVGATDEEIAGVMDFYRGHDRPKALLAMRDESVRTNPGFWAALDELIASSEVIIDRPAGTRHPRYPALVYGVDYGYLAGTSSMDLGGIDVWRGTNAGARLTAIMVTVDMVKRDSEIKLLIDMTDDEIAYVEGFHNNSDYMKGLLIRRE